MNSFKLCGTLDSLMVDKDAHAEITKVRNNEDICKKINVLENDSSSKKKGASIATKCSDVVWNNNEASMDRISIVKKCCFSK